MSFLLGLIYASFVEWFVHKYLFHGLGKKKNSIFAYHIRQHHKTCCQNENRDEKISKRETFGVLFLLVLNAPVYFLSPMFFYAVSLYGIAFIVVHNIVHKNVALGKKLFPWHWDHHMRFQNHNMNVVLPIADYILKTRKKTWQTITSWL